MNPVRWQKALADQYAICLKSWQAKSRKYRYEFSFIIRLELYY